MLSMYTSLTYKIYKFINPILYDLAYNELLDPKVFMVKRNDPLE